MYWVAILVSEIRLVMILTRRCLLKAFPTRKGTYQYSTLDTVTERTTILFSTIHAHSRNTTGRYTDLYSNLSHIKVSICSFAGPLSPQHPPARCSWVNCIQSPSPSGSIRVWRASFQGQWGKGLFERRGRSSRRPHPSEKCDRFFGVKSAKEIFPTGYL